MPTRRIAWSRWQNEKTGDKEGKKFGKPNFFIVSLQRVRERTKKVHELSKLNECEEHFGVHELSELNECDGNGDGTVMYVMRTKCDRVRLQDSTKQTYKKYGKDAGLNPAQCEEK